MAARRVVVIVVVVVVVIVIVFVFGIQREWRAGRRSDCWSECLTDFALASVGRDRQSLISVVINFIDFLDFSASSFSVFRCCQRQLSQKIYACSCERAPLCILCVCVCVCVCVSLCVIMVSVCVRVNVYI